MATVQLRLVDRVLIFFARNPEEELTSVDVALKFDVSQEEVRCGLRHAVDDGRIRKESRGRYGQARVIYRAGPALLETIGLVRLMDACASTGG